MKYLPLIIILSLILLGEISIVLVLGLGNMNSTNAIINETKCLILKEDSAMTEPFIKRIIENNNRHEPLFPFRAPFRLIVSGPSEAGKTTFVMRLIKESALMIQPLPDKITWFYGEYQNWFQSLTDRIQFVEGLSNASSVLVPGKKHLIIIDDLFQEVGKETVSLFTVGSHHRNISVIFITQNFFHKSGHQRNISLNASHVAFFKNPRDKMQIYYLSRQMYPKNPNFLIKAYEDATINPYSYLLIDLTQGIDERFRVRAKIFPGEYTRIYQPSKK